MIFLKEFGHSVLGYVHSLYIASSQRSFRNFYNIGGLLLAVVSTKPNSFFLGFHWMYSHLSVMMITLRFKPITFYRKRLTRQRVVHGVQIISNIFNEYDINIFNSKGLYFPNVEIQTWILISYLKSATQWTTHWH